MDIITINQEVQSKKQLLISSLLGGASAGLVVDVVLFPLDTLKTRMQAVQGFKQAGGLRGLYKGIGPQMIGSGPQAALFFITYEFFKYETESRVPKTVEPLIYMTGAAIAETVANFVRVPMEVVKQRRQTAKHTSLYIFKTALRNEGVVRGLYRGFGSTIIREIPFSIVQFPILEYLKTTYRIKFKNNIPLESKEVAVCGAIAGGVAAAITTPLDVAKTRIMLAHKKIGDNRGVVSVLRSVYRTQGITGLFAGFVPRVLWISLGGYIFFGMYDFSKNTWSDWLDDYFR